MNTERVVRTIKVDGPWEPWEVRCRTALSSRPFRIMGASEPDTRGVALSAAYGGTAPMFGPMAYLVVDLVAEGEGAIIHIEAETVTDNPLRQLTRNLGHRAIRKLVGRLT